MFKQDEVPPSLWERANHANEEERLLIQEIEAVKSRCQHDWQKVTWQDPNYSPRLDGVGRGGYDVIKEFHCPLCNARKPLVALPFDVCHLCGGKMAFDRHEQFGMSRAQVHKCQDCGHEYDTT